MITNPFLLERPLIAASILSAKFANLGAEMNDVLAGGAWAPVNDSSGDPLVVQPSIFDASTATFASDLTAGTYRVVYLDGTMSYSGPGYGDFPATEVNHPDGHGFYVSGNRDASLIETKAGGGTQPFQASGSVGVYLVDNPYYDNAAGPGGSPEFTLEELLPRISVVATQPTASEAGQVPAVFTVSRDGDSYTTQQSIGVKYSLTGSAVDDGGVTDTTGGTVTIPAGSNSATITVTPVNDSGEGPDEVINVTLLADTGQPPAYADPATNPVAEPATATGSKKDSHITLQDYNPLQGTPPTDSQKQAVDSAINELSDSNPDLRAKGMTDLTNQLLNNPALIDYANTAAMNTQSPEVNQDEVNVVKNVTTQLKPFDVTINATAEHTRLHVGLRPADPTADFVRIFIYVLDPTILTAGTGKASFELDNLPPGTSNIDANLIDMVGLKSGATQLVIKEQFYRKDPNNPGNDPNNPPNPIQVGTDRNLSLNVTVQ